MLHHDALPISVEGVDSRRIEVRLLTLPDFAVSKLSRFSEQDQDDSSACRRCRMTCSAKDSSARCAKAAWARLIRKLFEFDPLECPKCKTPMRIIGLIHDAVVVREILTHLGRSQPEALKRAPPVPLEAWPAHASLALTYDSVPDIA